MTNQIVISAFDVCGSDCWMAKDGQIVYDRISQAFKNDTKVSLSFKKVEVMTTTFLHTAIGQLYGKFSEEKIRELLSVKDIEQDDLILIKKVVDNSKKYFTKWK